MYVYAIDGNTMCVQLEFEQNKYKQEHMKGRSIHLELSKKKVNGTDFSC